MVQMVMREMDSFDKGLLTARGTGWDVRVTCIVPESKYSGERYFLQGTMDDWGKAYVGLSNILDGEL